MYRYQIYRIFWKEFHAHKGLWLGCLLLTLLFQVLFLWAPVSWHRASPIAPLMFGLAISGAYAIACGSLLYTKEVEEGTREFLSILPIRPWVLLLGKLSFLGLSAAAMFVVLGTAGMLLSKWSADEIFAQFRELNETSAPELYTWLAATPIGALAAAFCSLFFRRTIWAIVAAVLCTALIGSLSFSASDVMHQVYAILIASTLIVPSWLLVRLWITGQPYWPARRRISLPTWRRGARASWPLRWCVARVSPTARTFLTLVWKELQVARKFFLVGLCVFLGAFGLFYLVESNRGDTSGIVFLAAMIFTVLLCYLGIQVFGRDRQVQFIRYYNEHAVPASLIWWSKQVVWPLLLILPAVPVVLTWLAEIDWLDKPPRGRSGDLSLTIAVVTAITIYLNLLVIGQWFRSTIVSLILALLVSLTWLTVHNVGFQNPELYWKHVSLVVILSLLGISYLSMGDWLRNTWSWKTVVKRGTLLIAPYFLIQAWVTAVIVYEVPNVDPGFDWQEHEAQLANFDPAFSQQWQEFEDFLKLYNESPEEHHDEFVGWVKTLAQAVRQNPELRVNPEIYANDLDRVLAIRSLVRSFEKIEDTYKDTYEDIYEVEIYGVQKRLHERYLQKSLDEQWAELESVILLNNYLINHDLTGTSLIYNVFNAFIFREMQAWAQDPRQTPESLQRLIELPGLKDFLLPAKQYYITWRQFIEGRGWLRAVAQKRGDDLAKFEADFLSSGRSQKLRELNYQTNLYFKNSSVYLLPTSAPDLLVDVEERLSQTNQSDQFFRTLKSLGDDSVRIYRHYQASRLIAALEKYRLQHGSYPTQLETLADDVMIGENSIDYFDFIYLPQGLSKPLVLFSDDPVIPANQPLLIPNFPKYQLDHDSKSRLAGNEDFFSDEYSPYRDWFIDWDEDYEPNGQSGSEASSASEIDMSSTPAEETPENVAKDKAKKLENLEAKDEEVRRNLKALRELLNQDGLYFIKIKEPYVTHSNLEPELVELSEKIRDMPEKADRIAYPWLFHR